MSIQIKLKNSVVQDSTPSTSDLPVVGELALNANINSIGGFMRASDNSIVKIFGPGSVTTPTATTTVSGIAELATNTETTTGSATNRVVTPAGLNAVTVAERTTSNSNYVAKAGSTLTGVLTMPNGSNSAPAINFGDSDSGIFGGTNTVSLAAGGTTRLTADTGVSVVGTLAVTGAITSTNDITLAEALRHAGDSDTLFRFPANDTVSVENGGSESLRVTSNNRVLIGTSSSRLVGNAVDALLQIEGMDQRAKITLVGNGANTSGSFINLAKSRSTSIGGTTAVQDGDILGQLIFAGADGTDLISKAANIKAEVDGTPGSNDMPGRLVFGTTADGADSPTTRLTIDSAGTSSFNGNISTNGTINSGNIGVAGTAPTISFTDINANDDFEIKVDGGLFEINDTTNSANRFKINSAGVVTIGGTTNFGNNIHVTGPITGIAGLNIEGATVFNESGADVDFRIEGDTDPFLFNADAGNDRIGINAQLPQARLHVSNENHLAALSLSSGTQIVASGTGNATSFVGISILGGNSSGASILNLGDIDDENSGQIFYSHLDDSLRISTNASEKMRLDSSGRLLLGTTTKGHAAADELTISNTASGADMGITLRSATNGQGAIYFSDGTSGDAEYRGIINYNHSSDFFSFFTAASERMRIASDGKIGINEVNPVEMLHIKAEDNTDSFGGLIIKANNNSVHMKYGWRGLDANSGGDIRFAVGGTEMMRVLSSGKVGLGRTSADEMLHIKADDNSDGFGGIKIDSNNGSINCKYGWLGASGSNSFRIAVAGTERMRVASDGKVGIGTTSPHQKLHVHKGSAGSATSDPNSVLTLENSTHCILQMLSPAANSNRIMFGDPDDPDTGEINYDHSTNSLRIKTAAAERMRITSAGLVGIGTTSPQRILHSSAGSSDNCILATSGASNAFIGFADSGTTNQTGLSVRMGSSGDSLIFQTGGTNTRLLIDSSGRVGIGTSPVSDIHTASSSDHIITHQSTTVGADIRMNFRDSGNTDKGGIHYLFNGNSLKFIIAEAERMRIDSSGNVGIGLTSIAGRVHAHSAANTATFLADGEVDNPQYPSYGFAGQNADNGSRGAGMYLPGDNTLAFATAGNERVRISGDGFVSIGNTSAQGSRLFIDSAGVSQNTLRLKQSHSSALVHFNEVTNTSYVGDGYKYHGSRTAGSNYNFMAFDSGHASTPDREFTIRGDGNAFADGTWNNNGADYAEFFESSTGSAIPVGTAVVLDNNKVRAATSSDAVGNIIGVVRPKEPGQASMTIGNTAWNKWHGKYLTDDFDRFILDEHNVINWTEADGTFHSYESHAIPSDVTVPSDAQTLTKDVNGNKFTHYRLNPDYDSSKTYIPRSDRDEWIIVGLVGQVKVLKGQAVNDRWVKMKDVSDTVEEYFIR